MLAAQRPRIQRGAHSKNKMVPFSDRAIAWVGSLVLIEYRPLKLARPAVTITCNHRGAQFAFSSTKPRNAMHSGHPAIRLTSPAIMLAQEQRRALSRPKAVPAEANVSCELRMGLQAFDARLIDVGLDGAAYMLCEPGMPVCDGTRLEGVRIRTAGTEPLVVDVDVTKVDHAKLPDGRRATRIGCRIAAERDRIEKLIRLFIIDLQ